MRLMTKDVRHILAINLKHLMDTHDVLNTRRALCQRLGGTVSPRTLTAYLNPAPEYPMPAMEKVEAIAKAYGLDVWELLHPTLGKTPLESQLDPGDLEAARRIFEKLTPS